MATLMAQGRGGGATAQAPETGRNRNEPHHPAALAIVVVLYHSRDEVEELWASLRAQEFGDWRLVAVDNAPGDGAAAFLEHQGDRRVSVDANPGNVGFARAVNSGLRRAVAEGAKRILLLNPDVVLPPGFLRDLVAQWEETGADVIAPRVMQLERPAVAWYAGGHFDRSWALKNRHEPHDPAGPPRRVVEFASGCCLGLSAAVLGRVGLLDESFFVYWEDADFCLRLAQAGVPIHYVAEPFLLHRGAASSGGDRTAMATRLSFFGHAVVLRKHLGLRQGLAMALRLFLKELGRQGEPPGHAARVGWALVRGFTARLRPVPRL
jgi:GT2 family glycosyltransferase